MKSNSRVFQFSLISVAVLSLAACSSQSKWSALYESGKKAVAEGKLTEAEKDFAAAIEDGEKNRVPEKEYAVAITDMGRTLVRDNKEEDAIPYLVRALQLGSATKMPLEENVELLHKLARAEAKAEDWEEACGTEKALIGLLEVEKSPWTPELGEEKKFNESLKAQLAEYRKEHPQISQDYSQKLE